MPLGKQARILSKAQVEAVLGYLSSTRQPDRNRVIFLLSVKAGLRAKEIASLTWEMIVEAKAPNRKSIHLQDRATKGQSGRIIPINPALATALSALKSIPNRPKTSFVVFTERSLKMSPQAVVNLFSRWYGRLGFNGCSSHSGRRTFITNTARKISTVGGSLRDVQSMAGHSSLRTTQRYIEENELAKVRVVGML